MFELLGATEVVQSFDARAFSVFLWTLIYGASGIVLTVLGYKIFDWISPLDVEKEIGEKQNIAVAIVCAAVIVGIALVTAAAIG